MSELQKKSDIRTVNNLKFHNLKKIIVVGDGAVGKTCLLVVFQKKEFPHYYIPTVFENSFKDIEINNRKVKLELCDTAGQEDYARLRPLVYPNTDVALLCCSVDFPNSLNNCESTWLPEILHYCSPLIKIILVVNKVDLRHDEQCISNLSFTDESPLTKGQCVSAAKRMNVAGCIENSAKLNLNVYETFSMAAKIAIEADSDVVLSNNSAENLKNTKKCIVL